MTARPCDTPTPHSSDTGTEGLPNDDPPPTRWYVMGENYRAARRALYAARAQLT